MKRTNTTNDTPPQPKRSMTSAPDLDPNTAALAEQERQRTLVFIGLPESNAIRPSEHVQEDREAATKILDHLEVEAQPTAVFRLGRYAPQRTTPRPLKVVMPTPTHQHVALGGWKRERARLRSQKNLARLFVRPALTKEQLKEEYEARARKRQQDPAPVAPKCQQQNPASMASKRQQDPAPVAPPMQNPYRQKNRLPSMKMGQNRRRPVKTLQNHRSLTKQCKTKLTEFSSKFNPFKKNSHILSKKNSSADLQLFL
ncbi:hypothetical protein niasHT_002791 [Heterodera trifolii]|uniref:Uncharacterized protein n=1 Tax=Heterodera trifolii TaxID=157864 RepID=A0ABD2M899_9BILA